MVYQVRDRPLRRLIKIRQKKEQRQAELNLSDRVRESFTTICSLSVEFINVLSCHIDLKTGNVYVQYENTK